MRRSARFFAVPAALAVGLTTLSPQPLATGESAAEHWQSVVRLADTGHLQDAAMAAGRTVATWTDHGAVWAGYRSADGSWDVAALGRGRRPRVDINDDGLAVVAWQRRVGDQRTIRVTRRDAVTSWSAAAVAPGRATTPVVAVGDTGQVHIAALPWRSAAPYKTAVVLHRWGAGWSSAVLSRRGPLVRSPELQRSLSIAALADGKVGVGWKQGRFCRVAIGRARPESVSPCARGVLSLAAPEDPVDRLHFVTPFEVGDVEPGLVGSTGWGVRGTVVAAAIDLDRGPRGIAAWVGSKADGRMWVTLQRSGRGWGSLRMLTRRADGLGGATWVDPRTGLAFWRTRAGRLRVEANTGSGWARERMLGRQVEAATLTSDRGGGALLAWSSGAPAPGVFAATR
jgi:hypothetical protein